MGGCLVLFGGIGALACVGGAGLVPGPGHVFVLRSGVWIVFRWCCCRYVFGYLERELLLRGGFCLPFVVNHVCRFRGFCFSAVAALPRFLGAFSGRAVAFLLSAMDITRWCGDRCSVVFLFFL